MCRCACMHALPSFRDLDFVLLMPLRVSCKVWHAFLIFITTDHQTVSQNFRGV